MSSEWSIHIHYINRIYTVWLHPLGHTMSKHSSTERSRVRMNWWPMKGYPSEWAGIYCSSEYTDWTSSHFVRSMWSTKIIGTWCHTSTAPHTHTHTGYTRIKKKNRIRKKNIVRCVLLSSCINEMKSLKKVFLLPEKMRWSEHRMCSVKEEWTIEITHTMCGVWSKIRRRKKGQNWWWSQRRNACTLHTLHTKANRRETKQKKCNVTEWNIWLRSSVVGPFLLHPFSPILFWTMRRWIVLVFLV